MTIRQGDDDESFDRRSGLGRRVTDLETKYSMILVRLDAVDALKNQFQGGINLLKFIGFTGLAIGAVAAFKYILAAHP